MRPERRSLLKSALASAAIAPAMLSGCLLPPAAASILKTAPYVPVRASSAADPDDDELVQLGSELRSAMADHVPIWRRWADLSAAFNREAHRRLTGSLDTPEGLAAYVALSREMGEEAASDENDRAIAAIDALSERIYALQPTTFAGLHAWYAALLWQATHPRERESPRDKLNYDRQAIFEFDAMLGRLAGATNGANA